MQNWNRDRLADRARHRYGTGSPEARKALASSDRNLWLTPARLQELGLADRADIIVLADHGFSVHDFRVDTTRTLINAGLKVATSHAAVPPAFTPDRVFSADSR